MIHQALSPGGVDRLPPRILLPVHGGQFTGGVLPQNQFVPEIVSPLSCSSVLVRHTLLVVYFFKEHISFIGSIDKCHTSVFNALTGYVVIVTQDQDPPTIILNFYEVKFDIDSGTNSYSFK